MKRKELEMRLQRVAPFDEPSAALEQYPTPSTIASDILFSAYVNGDVCDKTVNDLGCGTGIFSIGAKLLGANVVRGYDISRSALDVARKNIELLNVDVELMECDVTEVNDRADTTFMNPPFGCQNRRADRLFLDKAMELSDSIYSIHMADTLDFLNEYIESKGREIVAYATYKYKSPHTFTFHRKEKKEVDIVVVNVR